MLCIWFIVRFWLNLSLRWWSPVFLHLPMDDSHFGYKQKFVKKTLSYIMVQVRGETIHANLSNDFHCKMTWWRTWLGSLPYNFWTLVAHPTCPTWKTGMMEVLYQYLSHKRELPTYKIVTWKTSNGWHSATNNKQVNCWIMCMLCVRTAKNMPEGAFYTVPK